jgi:hypothetical protein
LVDDEEAKKHVEEPKKVGKKKAKWK